MTTASNPFNAFITQATTLAKDLQQRFPELTPRLERGFVDTIIERAAEQHKADSGLSYNI